MTGQSSALYFALTDMWTLEAVIFQKSMCNNGLQA